MIIFRSENFDASLAVCKNCDITDHVVRFTKLSPTIFAYCKRSKTGGGEGLGTRLCAYKWALAQYKIFPLH